MTLNLLVLRINNLTLKPSPNMSSGHKIVIQPAAQIVIQPDLPKAAQTLRLFGTLQTQLICGGPLKKKKKLICAVDLGMPRVRARLPGRICPVPRPPLAPWTKPRQSPWDPDRRLLQGGKCQGSVARQCVWEATEKASDMDSGVYGSGDRLRAIRHDREKEQAVGRT